MTLQVEAPPTAVRPASTSTPAPARRRPGWVSPAARSVASALASLAIALAGWQLLLVVLDVDDFIGRGPADVWSYLVTSANAGANRSVLVEASRVTLRDASIGLVVGTGVAIVTSVAFALWRPVERTVLPVAMILRSVPLVAMTPLVAVVLGRDVLAVTVVSGLVTFFPTLVNVSLALRSCPRESLELCHAYGGSKLDALRKVQVPAALPALFASLRIAAPLALVGALVAERLVTGQGLGYLMEVAVATFQFDQLWAAVVLVTLYSFVLYSGIGLVEVAANRRFTGTTRGAGPPL